MIHLTIFFCSLQIGRKELGVLNKAKEKIHIKQETIISMARSMR